MVNVKPWHIQKDWDRVSDPIKLYTKILDRNTQQFLKSIKSPFATDPLGASIGRDSSGPMTQSILDSTVDMNFISSVDHSTETKHFIQALKIPLSKKKGKPLPPFKYSLDIETYNKIFNKATVSTASSPSGLHYGHYIAAPEDNPLTAVNAIFTRVPFQHGFPFERWSSSIQCMLQNKHRPFITKLRIIELFEADFNSRLKYILGRKLLYHGEEHVINSTQTHDSRPVRATHDALNITKLAYDIARLDKVTMVSIFKDAAGYYDRMRYNLMKITTERMG